jgi:hypothetical protein
MVTLPADFVATRYNGYFWNLKEKKLYSIKVGGVLRPLANLRPPCHWNHFVEGYTVSVNGRRRTVTTDYLKKLVAKNSVIPVEKK